MPTPTLTLSLVAVQTSQSKDTSSSAGLTHNYSHHNIMLWQLFGNDNWRGLAVVLALGTSPLRILMQVPLTSASDGLDVLGMFNDAPPWSSLHIETHTDPLSTWRSTLKQA